MAGCCRAEAIRTGFMLAQGGEFAFVLLSLAKELKVLPDELNRLLIIVVVLSMALTPLLADFGEMMAAKSMTGERLAIPCVQILVTDRFYSSSTAWRGRRRRTRDAAGGSHLWSTLITSLRVLSCAPHH